MGYFADKIKDKLSSMSDEEFDHWWQTISLQRTDADTITAADYQSVIDNYIEGNMVMDIDSQAEGSDIIVPDGFEFVIGGENYNLAA